MWTDEGWIRSWQIARNTAMGYGLPLHDAEDVASDVMLRVLGAMQRGQDINGGYVRLCTRSVLTDRYRRLTARRERLRPLSIDEQAERGIWIDPPTTDDYSVAHEYLTLLDSCTSKQRRLIEMTVDGWTYDEIAHAMGVSVNGVKKMMVRARRSARRSL